MERPKHSVYPGETPVVLHHLGKGSLRETTVEMELNRPERKIVFVRHPSMQALDLDFHPFDMKHVVRHWAKCAEEGPLFHDEACWAVVRTTNGAHLYNVSKPHTIHPKRVRRAVDHTDRSAYWDLTRAMGADPWFTLLSLRTGTRIRVSKKTTQEEPFISEFIKPGDDLWEALLKEEGSWHLKQVFSEHSSGAGGSNTLTTIPVLFPASGSQPELNPQMLDVVRYLQATTRIMETLEREVEGDSLVARLQVSPAFRKVVEESLQNTEDLFFPTLRVVEE